MTMDDEYDDEVEQALEARREALAALPGVVGTALGRARDGTATVCIYVRRVDDIEMVDRRARGLLAGTPVELSVSGEPTGQS